MPKPTSKLRRRIIILLRSLVLLYLLWCSVLYFAQDRLIFPRHLAGSGMPDATLPKDAQRWWLHIAPPRTFTAGPPSPSLPADAHSLHTNDHVEAWFFPSSDLSNTPKPLLVYFHGNGDLIDYCLDPVQPYRQRGFNILLIEYRGYGRSGGTPSQAAIVSDSIDFIRKALTQPSVDSARLLYHGRSLGTGVAAQVSLHIKPAALILESPFTSVASFASKFLVPTFLVSSPFDTRSALSNPDSHPPPTLILAAPGDEIVPYSHGVALSKSIPDATLFTFDGNHHTPINALSAVWQRIDDFLAASGFVPNP